MPLSPGDLIADKYRIERLLGQGRMGRVYVATHGVLRKQVALKVMVERFRVSPDLVERFFREAVAATKVDHPAIAQVFDAGVHEQKPFMVMELLQGEDLDQRLKREGRLSVEGTLQMARPILSALEAAHRAGVVHRDIKPPNIFLARRPDGVVTPKLLDFGIAKHINDPFFDRLTASGSVLGTPMYIAPEQVENEAEVDHRADIYSIGVTLFHCLSGTTPFEAASFPELIGKMFSEEPRDLGALAPDVPAELTAWVQRCLALDPNARPQSARALLDGLSGAQSAADEEDANATVAVQWGAESPAPAVHPPTRHVPIPSSSPPQPPTRLAPEVAGGETPPKEGPVSTAPPRVGGRKRMGAGPVLLGVAALFGLIAAVGVGIWFFTRPDPMGVTTSVPPSRTTGPIGMTDATPANMLDAGAPMEPSTAQQTSGQHGAATEQAVEGRAQLDVYAEPPGECYLDGERIGPTPLTSWVSAGPHRISIVYGPMHRVTREVEIRRGEHRVLRIDGAGDEPAE